MLRDVKVKPGKADLPPRLHWECQVWEWFWRLAEPPAFGGPLRPQRAAWLDLVRRLGWCEDTAFELLQVIESELAKHKPGAAGE